MLSTKIVIYFFTLVSHTVEDLVFIWNMTDPLVVNAEIELPQLDISNNYTTDCTIEYSTGKLRSDYKIVSIKASIFPFRQLHLSGHCLQSAPPPGLSSISYVYSISSDCGHVVDIVLD